MKNMWKKRRLEFITLFVFTILVATSLFILYSSYSNYISATNESKIFEHKILMFISTFILFVSFLIVFLKRDYFFTERNDNSAGLEHLLNEIKCTSEPEKIEQFKQMLKDKNHVEVYGLISSMITELQESKKMADDANQTKTLFLANISHEIRTPINGIVGFTKFLTSTKMDNEQRDFVNIIRKSSEDLLGVVNNILDISKIESGRVELEKSFFNVIDELENLSDIYALEASKKDINLSFWIDPIFASILIESDAEKLKQILINLISNALKFTSRGNNVAISIKKKKLENKNISIEFMVNDTGIGISEAQQSQVFTAFTQADNSSTREYGGTGLGLTIANSWVKMLGSFFKLESIEGRGTTFSFILESAYKKVLIEDNNKGLRVALYAPYSGQEKTSYKHLIDYLSQVKGLSLELFKTFVDCKDAPLGAFDILYILYNDIDKDELQRIVARYSAETQIIFVTKLNNRFKILDIAPIFSQIIYEPITFSKIRNSINISSKHKETLVLSDTKQKIFKLKALVVEDNLVNQKMIIHTLKALGIESDSADNGEIAVGMFKEKNYDIIFMDIQMPVMNGVLATKEILKYEKIEKLDHTPIIAVTTNTLKGDRERYLDVGMDEYISKPISSHKFLSVIKQFYSTEHTLDNDEIEKNNKSILLYKQIPTEAKNMAIMLTDIGYSVDIAKGRTACSDMLSSKSYDLLLLDRSENDSLESILMDKINSHQLETLLFIDENTELQTSDLNQYIHLINKSANFIEVEEKVANNIKINN